MTTKIRVQERPKAELALEKERQCFERRRKQLMRRYAGQFVALSEGHVVDHDRDDEALAARMFAKFGDGAFYIGHLQATRFTHEMPSPGLAN